MPPSTDVTRRYDQITAFPDRCIVCAASEPDDSIALNVPEIGWLRRVVSIFTLLTYVLPSRKYDAPVPVCRSCKSTYTREKRMRVVVQAAWLGVGIVAVLALFADPLAPANRLPVAGIVVAIVIPLVVYDAVRPPRLVIEPGKASVRFEFRDADYARAFAEHNGTTVD